MIDSFCRDLPYFLSDKMKKEYSSRKTEIDYLLKQNESSLHEFGQSIYYILALSIYYRNYISILESMCEYSVKLRDSHEVKSIEIGNSKYGIEEYLSLQNKIFEFNKLLLKYRITSELFDYSDAKTFLKKINDHIKIYDHYA